VKPHVLSLVALLLSAALAAADRPNVVLILADDLGAHDLGCFGSTFYETPNLDRLAKDGMRFTRAYAACPVCSPTRAALMTGKYPPRTGITDYINLGKSNQPDRWARNTALLPAPYRMNLPPGEVTLAGALKAEGYVTGIFGKWHLSDGPDSYPGQHGFDVTDCGKDALGYYGADRADLITASAVKFIEANQSKPFFLYLPHNLVHTPLVAKPGLVGKYKKKAAALPARPEAERFRPEGERRDRRVQDHAVYAAMVEDLDTNIGLVLRKLDDLRLTGNTLVLFTSDNGGLSTSEGSPTSNAPLRAGKGWLYEGGLRVPLIVRWPEVVKPGTASDAPAVSTDFYPTCLEAVGAKPRPGQHRDGVSLLPALRGKPLAPRPLYWHYPHYGNQGGRPGGAVRDGDWKLIEWFDGGLVELFNLKDDPGERKDRAKADPDRAKALQDKLAAWRSEVGAKMPSPNPGYEPGRQPKKTGG
jgi:arylsulfatase A-like enzyme